MERIGLTTPRITVRLYLPRMLLKFGDVIAEKEGQSFEDFIFDRIVIQICNPKTLYELAMGNVDSVGSSRKPYPDIERVYLSFPRNY